MPTSLSILLLELGQRQCRPPVIFYVSRSFTTMLRGKHANHIGWETALSEEKAPLAYSTVTDLAKLRGKSTFKPSPTANQYAMS